MLTERSRIGVASLLLVACVGCLLCGCGGRRSSPILVVGCSFSGPMTQWDEAYRRAFKEQSRGYRSLSLSWFQNSSDTAAVSGAMEKWMSAKVSGILSFSSDHLGLLTSYQKALSSGIPVLLTGDPPDCRAYSAMSAFSGLSAWDGGRMAAELLNRTLGCTGTIACVMGPRGSAAEQQDTEGFKAALQRLSSRIEVVATVEGRGNATLSYQKVLNVLCEHPDPDAFYAMDDTIGSAVIRALRQKGCSPGEVQVVARGGSKESIVDLREGWYVGIVNQDPVLCARQDIWLMEALLEKDRRLPHVSLVRQELTTKANVNEFAGW